MKRTLSALGLIAAGVAHAELPSEFTESFEGALFTDDGGYWYAAQLNTGNSVFTDPSAAKSGVRGFVSIDVQDAGNLEAGNEAQLLGGSPRVGARVWWRTWMRVDALVWDVPSNGFGQYVSVGGTHTTIGYPAASVGLSPRLDGGLELFLGYSEGEQLDQHSIETELNVVPGRWYLVETYQGGIGSPSDGELALFVDGVRLGTRSGLDFTMDGGVPVGFLGVGFQFPRSSTMQMSYDELAVRLTPMPSRLRVSHTDAGLGCVPIDIALVSSADSGLAGALATADVELAATNASLHASADCSGTPLTSIRFDAGELQHTVFACANEAPVRITAQQGSYLPGETAFTVAPGTACAFEPQPPVNPSLFSVCAVAPFSPLLALALLLAVRRFRARTS